MFEFTAYLIELNTKPFKFEDRNQQETEQLCFVIGKL